MNAETRTTPRSEGEISIEQFYAGVLGLDQIPETPDDLPPQIKLDIGLIGNLLAMADVAFESGKVSEQNIVWDKKKRIAQALAEGRSTGIIFKSKALISISTSSERMEYYHNKGEIMHFRRQDALAYMFLKATVSGASLLVQTKKSHETWRSPGFYYALLGVYESENKTDSDLIAESGLGHYVLDRSKTPAEAGAHHILSRVNRVNIEESGLTFVKIDYNLGIDANE